MLMPQQDLEDALRLTSPQHVLPMLVEGKVGLEVYNFVPASDMALVVWYRKSSGILKIFSYFLLLRQGT